jgi:hypothetical protein
MVSSGRLHTPADLAVGLLAHLTCGMTGTALGTCCTRLIIGRQGYAFATALLLLTGWALITLVALTSVSSWLAGRRR